MHQSPPKITFATGTNSKLLRIFCFQERNDISFKQIDFCIAINESRGKRNI